MSTAFISTAMLKGTWHLVLHHKHFGFRPDVGNYFSSGDSWDYFEVTTARKKLTHGLNSLSSRARTFSTPI